MSKGLELNSSVCDYVQTISVSEETPYFTVYEGNIYTKDMTSLLYHPPRSVATKLVIPEGVKNIEDAAFMLSVRLKEVVMPDTVERIGVGAFHYSSEVTANISEGCKIIAESAFAESAIEEIHIPASVTEIASGAFSGTKELGEITVDAGNPVYCIKEDFLYDITENKIIGYPCGQGLYEVTIPEGTKCIGNLACAGIMFAKKICVPDLVEEIGDGAFRECSGWLEEVEFDTSAFSYIIVTVYYPEGNTTWTEDKLQTYGEEMFTGLLRMCFMGCCQSHIRLQM